MLTSNTFLKGRYRIFRQLKAGGMGAVYEALDESVSRVVALKETFAETDEGRASFEREAKLLANLEHPAFPRVIDHFREGDGQYLVMEMIGGNDLEELLGVREHPFTPTKVLEWADQILDALEELHAYRPPIIHRDIKPSNLKLTKKGRIKLLDFGIAKGSAGQMTTPRTEGSVRAFTPEYAPLEQVLRSSLQWYNALVKDHSEVVEEIVKRGTDPRADLYALAATMYHLLTGHAPIAAPIRAIKIWDGKQDSLLPAHEVDSTVPPEISAILMRAMALSPDQRPSDATEMRKDLRAVGAHKRRAGDLQLINTPPPPVPPNAPDITVPAADVPTPRPSPSAIKTITAVFFEKVSFLKKEASTAFAHHNRFPALMALGVLALLILVLGASIFIANRDSLRKLTRATATPQPKPTPMASFSDEIRGLNSSDPKIEMVLIRGRPLFEMGSRGKEVADPDEAPQQVTMPDFYISRYEVTQAQWRAVMGDDNQSKFKGDRLPVERVSWTDAKRFCDKLTQITNRQYQLPTEAQWEYACRAGTETLFSFGDSLTGEQANFDSAYPYPYREDLKEPSRKTTVNVDSFKPNGFGLYNMHGNVAEWCQDSYYDSKSGRTLRHVRGGDWVSNALNCRCAERDKRDSNNREHPGAKGARSIGIRVVVPLPPG